MTRPLPIDPQQPTEERLPRAPVARAYAVHLLTASGIAFLFLSAMEIAQSEPRPVYVFAWLIAATLVDAIDGPLARRFHVKRFAPSIDGRTIDDIADFIGFTFLPLLLVWRMNWLPGDADIAWLWIAPALIASLFGFANLAAKDESAGFFRGFPSYWNIAAFYFGLSAAALPRAGPWINAMILIAFTAMTVAPVWFLYPNLAPRPWRWPVLIGAFIWLALLLAMLPFYPNGVPGWLIGLSLVYPAFYLLLSLYLHPRRARNGTSMA